MRLRELARRLARAWEPVRDFRRYLAARLVSQTGTSMAPVALAFAVLQIHGGAGALGVVLAASIVPQMALMLIGGAVADRNPQGRILVASHVISGSTRSWSWCCW